MKKLHFSRHANARAWKRSSASHRPRQPVCFALAAQLVLSEALDSQCLNQSVSSQTAVPFSRPVRLSQALKTRPQGASGHSNIHSTSAAASHSNMIAPKT